MNQEIDIEAVREWGVKWKERKRLRNRRKRGIVDLPSGRAIVIGKTMPFYSPVGEHWECKK